MSGSKPVLRPDRDSKPWMEFCEALFVALGEDLPGLCMGNRRRSGRFYFSERLLEARGFDAEASLALYEKHGGFCDCEVLFNVDPIAFDEEVGA